MTLKNHACWTSVHEGRHAREAERVYWGGLVFLVTATIAARFLFESSVSFWVLLAAAFDFFIYGEWLAVKVVRFLARHAR